MTEQTTREVRDFTQRMEMLSPGLGTQIATAITSPGFDYRGLQREAPSRIEVLDRTTVLVDLAANPWPPSSAHYARENPGRAQVKLQRRDKDLFANDCRVCLYGKEHLHRGSRGEDTVSCVLDDLEFQKKRTLLHPNILDALILFPEMVPEYFRGRIYFPAVTYSNRMGYPSVRYGQWCEGKLYSYDVDPGGRSFYNDDAIAVLEVPTT